MLPLLGRGAKHRGSEPLHAAELQQQRGRRRLATAIVTACLFALCCWAAAAGAGVGSRRAGGAAATSGGGGGSDRLVIYIHAETDAEYRANLITFLQHASQDDDGRAEYIFVMQVDDPGRGGNVTKGLPPLPQRARYVFHRNECYDWGTAGWVLKGSGLVDASKYKYIFLLNSSVRGPFMPAYASGALHWTDAFTSRLKGDVKIVGPTISCEGSPWRGNSSANWRTNPHVQSYAIGFDQTALQVMMREGRVFSCHKDRWDAIWYGEVGSSAAILGAGFNLGSFLIRYQGVDWRDERFHACNQKISPINARSAYDGLDIDPLEVMFVKYKDSVDVAGHEVESKMDKYQKWIANNGQLPAMVVSNELVQHRAKFHADEVVLMQARGPDCFDHELYLASNEDLGRELAQGGKEAAWQHFVLHGQFENRLYRFTCDPNYQRMIDRARRLFRGGAAASRA